MDKELTNKIICLVIGILIGIIIMVIFMPKRIAKLSDGSEEVVNLSTRSISADEYYKLLKKQDKLSVLLREIDVSIIKGLYPNQDKESLDYANERYQTFLEQANLYGMEEKEALSSYGYSSKEEFIDYLKNDYYLNKYYQSKLIEQYKEEDFKSFYDNNYFDTRTVYIFSDASTTEVLGKIKNKLDKGSTPAKIISEFPGVAYNNIDISFMDYQYGEDVINAVKNLSKGKTSGILTNEVFGNYIVYVSNVHSSTKYEDVKESIKNYFMDNAEKNDTNVMYKIMIDLQKEYGIDFKDTELKDLYNKYVAEHTK